MRVSPALSAKPHWRDRLGRAGHAPGWKNSLDKMGLDPVKQGLLFWGHIQYRLR